MNTKYKIEDLIQSEFCLEEFSDTNLENYLNTNREALNVEGQHDIEGTLFLFDSADENYTKNYKYIDKKIFPSESLDPDPEKTYLPQNYFSQTKVSQTIERELTKLINNTENNGEIIFLACAKSTGKTLSQNIWIKNNHTLMEEGKIFWIRCDCEKLIQLVDSFGIDKISKIEEDIIANYFDIQFLSVLCKHYKSERLFFQQIFRELVDEKIALRVSGDYKNPVYSTPVSVLETIEEFYNDILREKKNKKNPKYNYGREVVLKSALGSVNKTFKIFENWRNLSKQIQNKLIDKGYKFLRIIDSVDNYKKYDKNGNYQIMYEFILKKIYTFNSNYVDNQIQEGSVAIICRKNTYWDYRTFYNHTKKATLQTSNFKHNLINRDNDELKRDNISIQNRRLEFLSSNISFKSKTLNIFEKIINYTASEQPFLYEFLRDEKHIGYLLRNKVYLVPALIFFQNKYNISDDKLDDFIKSYFPSNLLLNGYFSLNSFCRQEIDLGQMLFNIFYYDNDNDNKWQGLCCSRILQYLKNNGDVLKNDLIENIHQLFCYDKNGIKNKISRLTEYSLIKLNLNENNNNNVYNPKIIITNKGEACLDLIYSDFDILYHCSLDTPMPKSLIRKKYIHPHSNKLEIRNYAMYCLKSTISFIQYLKKADREERNYIDSLNIGVNSHDYLLPLNANNKIQENLIERAKTLETSLKGSILEDFEKFLSNFKEIKTSSILPNREESSKSKTISSISEDKHKVKKALLPLKGIETEFGINFGVIVAKIKTTFGKNKSE